MTHVTLKDKRTEHIANDVHLEGPIYFICRDGVFFSTIAVSI